VVQELAAADRLTAEIRTTRWHPVEEAWEEPPCLCRAPTQTANESSRNAKRKRSDGRLRLVRTRSRAGPERGRRAGAERLRGHDFSVERRWRYLTIGAASEEQAEEIRATIRDELPEAEVELEPTRDVPATSSSGSARWASPAAGSTPRLRGNNPRVPMIGDLWYKNAIIYSLDVETFMDADGDGCGDFEGLTRRLDYLESLGIDAVWLAPFQTSPRRDDGYDVADFFASTNASAPPADFVEFVREADSRGIRVPHRPRRQPHVRPPPVVPGGTEHSRSRLVRLVEETPPRTGEAASCSPECNRRRGRTTSGAREYYFHRFYDFEPDLNMDNPAVREEVRRIMGFWLQLGVAGFRMDAVPFVIEKPPAPEQFEAQSTSNICGSSASSCSGASGRRSARRAKRACRETQPYFGGGTACT
jgi:hypothetical protein